MRKPDTLELYVDYLIAHQGLISAKDLSEVLGNALSHDHITRAVAQPGLQQKDFWKLVKPFVRQIERDDGCIVVDDFLVEKPHSTPNSIITVNWDHAKQRYSLSINVLNFLYTVASGDGTMQINLPLAYEVVSKTEAYTDKKTGKGKMKSPKTKNELVRERLAVLCHQNQVRFRYVLWDTWFSAADNMKFVVQELRKHFVGAIKENRKVGLVSGDGKTGAYKSVSQQELQPGVVYKVRMESVPFDLFLVKKVHKNMDGSTGGSVSCHERWRSGCRANLPALPKTVEGGGVPQVSQAERRNRTVAHQDGALAEEPPVRLHVGLGATRKTENRAQEKPLCPEAQNLSDGPQGCLGRNS